MKILYREGEIKSEYLDLNEGVKDKIAISFMLLSCLTFCLIHIRPFM